MTRQSRPVRAVVATLGGWTAVRAALLWPSETGVAVVTSDAPLPEPRAKIAQPLVPADLWTPPARAHSIEIELDPPMERLADVRALAVHAAVVPGPPSPPAMGTALSKIAGVPVENFALPHIAERSGPAALPSLPQSTTRRFSGSFWALSRAGSGGASLANGGQLGGSQIGARLFYAPGPKALALTARASAPLASRRGREVSAGIALRGKTMGIIVEQRFALDSGGRDAPAVTVYGGVSEVKLAKAIRLDGYAQAGLVGINHPQAFIDGAVRVETTLLEEGRSRLSAGIAISGGAQPGVSRLDVGPQIVARVPVGDTPVRISAEWRQRIAGNAAPDSGPAITVGFDF